MDPRPNSQRLHGMDALRAVAMLLGIFLHGTISYKIHHDPTTWPSDPVYRAIGYDFLYLWIHNFRMQLFYLVGGFFARFLYFKIGERPFIMHRVRRILVPFVLSLIFLLPFSLAPFLYYSFMNDPHPIREVLHHLLRWNGMAHFWFLYYLLIFYAAMIGLLHIVPAAVRKAIADKSRKLNLACFRPVLLLIIPLVGILFLFETPMVEVYTGIFPKLPYLIYYGYFFGIGWFLHVQIDRLQDTGRLTWPFLLAGTALTYPMLMVLYHQPSGPLGQGWVYDIGVRCIGAVQTILLVFGTLGLFMRFFRKESRTMRYISDSSYWLYLIHMGILASLQILLFHSIIPGPLRFFLVMIITLLVSFATYDLFIRYTRIGEMLHGKRKRRPAVP
jgi:glucan biosynthesis protein C